MIRCFQWIVFAGIAHSASAAEPSLPAKIQFNRDIRPILSETCWKCHGPDEKAREAKLRLDLREEAIKDQGGYAVIVPKHPEKSELVRRITATDPDDHMPPAKSGKKLSERQVALLKQWIAEGAEYQKHWAFIPPSQPPVPQIRKSKFETRNPIDQYILARLETEKLTLSPEASREILIRRVTFDLTGLPPTPAEVDAFLADKSPNAYEKVVDRLLASPRYGERMTLDWLDASRYADTHGYHIDAGRDMTRWREWVIESFNRNQPFDQFTIDQVAGDLLPNPTLDQRIATGFHRNHMINFEGGAIPEEYHTAYIVDRVNTTATVWLGLTLGCAQCHDHKYDPLSQAEFYQLFAFFHNVPENGLDGSKGNAGPLLKVPTSSQQRQIDHLTFEIAQVENQLRAPMRDADAAQAEWETSAGSAQKPEWTTLHPVDLKSSGGATLVQEDDGAILVSGANPATETYTVGATSDLKNITAIRVEALPDKERKFAGRSPNGNVVMTDVRLAVGTKPAKFKAASADFSQDGFPVANAVDADPKTGWALYPEVGKRHFAIFELERPISGSEVLTLALDFQSQFGQHQLGRFRISATAATHPHGAPTIPDNQKKILGIAPAQRTETQRAELRDFFRASVYPDTKVFADEFAVLRKSREEVEGQIRTTMVMQEMAKPRDTFLLVRGQYDKKGEKVTAATPAVLAPLPKDAPVNRLGLARWLVAPENPLTARVVMNRFWQAYFGTGIVKTVEDFGAQGEWPSHPELLDWLATEFVRSGWDVKHVQRLIVTSATYRQSSVVTPTLRERDPENRLLARGPRLRLPAEFIRDQALAVSGLLNDEIGGKSVSPYQPAGLWEELMSRGDSDNWSAQKYKQDHGADLYRRTMYTFWKRTCPPPTLSTMDAPDREVCTVRRPRTNTPLQALILMNDPTYVEAARKLAERMITDGGTKPQERIAFAFRLATARKPTAKEISVLEKIFNVQLSKYRADVDAAKKLLAVGESPRNEKLDAAELAAWTIVANTILNLDETVTKG